MPLAVAQPHMAKESTVFALLAAVVVAGTVVLLAGVGAFEHMVMSYIAAGGAIMVVGILAMAGYVSMLDEPKGAEAGSGH